MSSQTADSSSTYLELGWTSPHIKLGNGYDFGVSAHAGKLEDKILNPL